MDANSTVEPSDGGLLHPGQSPPLTHITPTNQSGVVLIATALALVFAVVSLLIRLFIRFQFRADFAKDDVLSFSSMIFALIQAGLVFGQVSRGFGKTILDLSAWDNAEWQKYAYVSEMFYIITMWITKCAAACLFLRLSPSRTHIRSSQAVLVGSTIFTVTSIFMLALRCDLKHPWIYVDQRCEGLYTRWQAITAFDVLTELGLFAIALHMVQGLFVSLGKKAVVLFAFALRLGVIAPSIMRLNYLGFALASPDPSLDGVLAVVCTQIEICYAIVATTTPCLRPFMSALNTGYGGPGVIPTPKGSKASGSGNDYNLTPVSGRSVRPQKPKRLSRIGTFELEEKASRPIPELRWDNTQYNVAIETGERPRTGQEIEPLPDHDQNSLQSHDSKRMIISKNTEWTVDYEDQNRRI